MSIAATEINADILKTEIEALREEHQMDAEDEIYWVRAYQHINDCINSLELIEQMGKESFGMQNLLLMMKHQGYFNKKNRELNGVLTNELYSGDLDTDDRRQISDLSKVILEEVMGVAK